ncbi:hypothetical protein NMY22_g10187 [Coprinellus aureogranulatus]|nr:hypothetical protein NMY22_g10187 [Coprinellus aureogranulatus]
MQLKLASSILLVASVLKGAIALCSGSNWAIGERIVEPTPERAQWYYIYSTLPDQAVVDSFRLDAGGNICTQPRIGCSPAPIFINRYISPAGITYVPRPYWPYNPFNL